MRVKNILQNIANGYNYLFMKKYPECSWLISLKYHTTIKIQKVKEQLSNI
jgi:hypothetical protein